MSEYTVKIEMKSSNASANGAEVAKILRNLAETVEWSDSVDGPISDINGNKIGHAKIKFKQ